MKLGEVRQEKLANGRVRLSGEAIYDTAIDGVQSEWFYFEFPPEMQGKLTDSGNPWLVLFLPISAALGEPLEISRPVDALLLEGCCELLEVWHTWMPELKIIDLKVQQGGTIEFQNKRTATFFSGGVDSLYTLLQHEDQPNDARAEKIDDLITIFGIYAREKEIIDGQQGGVVRSRLDNIAKKFKKQRIEIYTNIYLTKFLITNSLRHSYGCALSATMLALDGVYSRVLIPGSSSYAYLAAAGSHPFADRLYSTHQTKFIADGCKLTRDGKINYLVQKNHDLSSLQVCSRDIDLKNCCACAKCVRTMLTLSTLGKLESCDLFREKLVDVDKVASIYCTTNSMKRCVENAAVQARQRGMTAIEIAATRALWWSAWVDNGRSVLGRLRQRHALLPHDGRLLAQIMGLLDSPNCSSAARQALDRFFAEHVDLFQCLRRLLARAGKEQADLEAPNVQALHLLEHALISTAICESTLDLQRQIPGVALVLPGVRYDSAEWLYGLGLVTAVPFAPPPG